MKTQKTYIVNCTLLNVDVVPPLQCDWLSKLGGAWFFNCVCVWRIFKTMCLREFVRPFFLSFFLFFDEDKSVDLCFTLMLYVVVVAVVAMEHNQIIV